MNGLISRVLHLKSTAAGVGVMALVVYTFKSFGCHLPGDWMVYAIGFVSGLPAVLAKG